eukprot:6491402-Amphidinium_carterae.1
MEWDVKHSAKMDLLQPAAVRVLRNWIRQGWVSLLWAHPPTSTASTRMGPHCNEVDFIGNQVRRIVHTLLGLAEECYRARSGFVMQLPPNCNLWQLVAMQSILQKPRVHRSLHDFCSNGMPWRRRSAFLWFGLPLGSCFHTCWGKHLCSYSGTHHVHPQSSSHGLFSQRGAFPYPHSFCQEVAREVKSALACKWSARLSKYFLAERKKEESALGYKCRDFLAEPEVDSEEPTSECLEESQAESADTRREELVAVVQQRHRADYQQLKKGLAAAETAR